MEDYQSVLDEAIRRFNDAVMEYQGMENPLIPGNESDEPDSAESEKTLEAFDELAERSTEKDYFIACDTDSSGRPTGITITDGTGRVLMDRELDPDDYEADPETIEEAAE